VAARPTPRLTLVSEACSHGWDQVSASCRNAAPADSSKMRWWSATGTQRGKALSARPLALRPIPVGLYPETGIAALMREFRPARQGDFRPTVGRLKPRSVCRYEKPAPMLSVALLDPPNSQLRRSSPTHGASVRIASRVVNAGSPTHLLRTACGYPVDYSVTIRFD
jgi:hypothetical protein